jgi:hypothetical protein
MPLRQTECPFCHEMVAARDYNAHIAAHTEKLPDGQQRDHVTVREEERFEGDLYGVPTAYIHERCGTATGMPDEIVRSYLADPFLYSNRTFCTGCGTYVPHSECRWIDTGEKLSDYFRELKRNAPQRRGKLMLELTAGVLITIGGGLLAAVRPDLWLVSVAAILGGLMYAGPRMLRVFVW